MASPRKPQTFQAFSRIQGSADRPLEHHRRYPGCRVLLFCGACAWARDYSPERIADRLRALRVGGAKTLVRDIARQVGWTCPACGRSRWTTLLAYPPGLDAAEIRRLTQQLRN